MEPKALLFARVFALISLFFTACATPGVGSKSAGAALLWCSAAMEARIVVDFGKEPRAEEQPRPWRGNARYHFVVDGHGSAGGRGVSHAPSIDAVLGGFWRWSTRVPLAAPPSDFAYKVGTEAARSRQEADPRMMGSYTVSLPEKADSRECQPLLLRPTPD